MTHHSTRRTVAAAVSTLALTATLVGAATPAHAAHHHKSKAEKHAHGLRAPASRKAYGGWVGSWSTKDGQIVYHLDPGARSRVKRYGVATFVSTLPAGARVVDATTTARAAWILAKYGHVADAGQDAATELALDQLVAAPRYGIHGKVTKKRLRKATKRTRTALRALAAREVADSALYAGPYTVRLSAPARTVAGARTGVLASVVSASGHPVSEIPVTVRAGGAVVGTARTGAAGTASFTFTHAAAWGLPLTATATVPETHLLVRTPSRRTATRAAVAGVRTSVTASAGMVVAAVPGLGGKMNVTDSSSPYPTSGPATGAKIVQTYTPVVGTDSALPDARTVKVQLVNAGTGSSCATRAVVTGAGYGSGTNASIVAVNANGTYKADPLVVTTYIGNGVPANPSWQSAKLQWRYTLSGDTYNQPVVACTSTWSTPQTVHVA